MTDNKIWREKDIRIARQSAIKGSVSLLDIAERLGLLEDVDSLEQFKTLFKGTYNELFDSIYQGMEK